MSEYELVEAGRTALLDAIFLKQQANGQYDDEARYEEAGQATPMLKAIAAMIVAALAVTSE